MRLASLLAASAVALTAAASAVAAWANGSTGGATAGAATLAAGPTPTASAPVLSLSITVTWPAVPLATGYAITRRNALGLAEAVGGTCAGVVTGTSCTETVLAGTYTYAVAVRRSAWTGPAGASSAPLLVPHL